MSNNILKIMEAYKSMVSEGKELDEMRGATAGLRQSKVFPLNKQSEADAFAKKNGGKVEKKGATLYVIYDLPEETQINEDALDKVPQDIFKSGAKSEKEALAVMAKHPTIKAMGRFAMRDNDLVGDIITGWANLMRKAGKKIVQEDVELEESELDEVRRGKNKSDDQMKKEKDAKAKAWWDSMDKKNTKKEALDPVDDKENDKKFKDRKDKDIDNDGDVDSSDEYLHKRRKATDDAIDGGKKPAKEAVESEDEVEAPAPVVKKRKVDSGRSLATKDIKHNDHTSDKKAEISKIESVDTREAFIAMWSDLEEAVNQKKDATAPEEIDSKESPKSKEFIAKHKQSDKKIEDGEEEGHDMATKAGRVTKQAPNRGNDNLSNGDKTPVKGK